MKRKRAILAVAVLVVLLVGAILLTAPESLPPRPSTVSFLGFSNALPFVGAPEEVRGHHAVFQVTNHTTSRIAYHVKAHASQPGGKGSAVTQAGNDLPGHGAGTFMVPTATDTNGWRFEVVTSILRPRPA